MRVRDGSPVSANALPVTSFLARIHGEVDQWLKTVGGSVGGTTYYDTWYWETYDGKTTTSRLYSFPATAQEKGTGVALRIAMDALIGGRHRFAVSLNNASVGTINLTGEGRAVFSFTTQNDLNDGINFMGLRQFGATIIAFDWYEIEYTKRLVFERGEMTFTAPLLATTAVFTLSGLDSQ